MGLSSNQARFLSLTTRQVDLEHRVQQICQRRLRLSSELERVATGYNNQISNRRLFLPNATAKPFISLANLDAIGYKVVDAQNNQLAGRPGVMNNMVPGSGAVIPTAIQITSQQQFLNMINNGTFVMNASYQLQCDLDLSSLGQLSHSVINGAFTGDFDGNGYAIKNMDISTTNGANNIGFFSSLVGANISNLVIYDSTINANNSWNIGGLAGTMAGTAINNCAVDVDITGSGSIIGGIVGRTNGSNTIDNTLSEGTMNLASGTLGSTGAGGLVGESSGNIGINHCISDMDITINDNVHKLGGFLGSTLSAGVVGITNSYADGEINIKNSDGVIGCSYVGGFLGEDNNNPGASINIMDCYTGVDFTLENVTNISLGGFYGTGQGAPTNFQITNCYADNTALIIGPDDPSNNLSAFAIGPNNTPAVDNYYNPNKNFPITNPPEDFATANAAAVAAGFASILATTTPGNPVLDMSLEEGLRTGRYALAKLADEFTQSPFLLGQLNYERVDWRTVPEVNDELYKSDDADAENKYDRIVAEINNQDKKLQLEQASVEVEYKAITSEKEAVKKILDTNASSSFKYFS